MSIVGYCMGPLIVGVLALVFGLWNPAALIINIGCVYWALKCSVGRIGRDLVKEKQRLNGLPLVLFFVLLDYIILII